MKRYAMIGVHLALAVVTAGPALGLDPSLCQIGAAYICVVCAGLSF